MNNMARLTQVIKLQDKTHKIPIFKGQDIQFILFLSPKT